MKSLRSVIILLSLILSAAASAQNNIDDLIKSLESKGDVETTYSERRSVKNKRLYRITMVLKFNRAEYYQRFEKAFESERRNSVSAVKQSDSRIYKFQDKHGNSTYTLTNNNNGSFTLVKSWRGTGDDSLDDTGDLGTDSYGCKIITSTECPGYGNIKSLTNRQLSDKRRAILNQQRQLAKKQRDLAKKQHDITRRHISRLKNLKRRHADSETIAEEYDKTRRRLAELQECQCEMQARQAELQAEQAALQQTANVTVISAI